MFSRFLRFGLIACGYVLLLALWTLCEVAGQILFKRGVDAIDVGEGHFGVKSFIQALRSRPIWDKYYTREDMEQQGFTDLRQIGSRSSMRLMNPDCPVIVNGDPQRIVPLWSLTVPELEFVEVYTDPTKSPTGGPAGGSRANLAAKKKQMSTAPKSPCGVALLQSAPRPDKSTNFPQTCLPVGVVRRQQSTAARLPRIILEAVFDDRSRKSLKSQGGHKVLPG